MPRATLNQWLDQQAEALDLGHQAAEQILPRLAAAGLFGLGIAPAQGGQGGTLEEALEAVAEVASHSLTAAFVFWGQRTFIEYLLQSPNTALREQLLPDLLAGRLAGASGLSNAMKFLAGIESLQIDAQPTAEGWRLDGQLPWVTNLRPQGFVVAAVVARPNQPPAILAIPGDLPGLQRSDDLQLLGLQASNTAAITLQQVDLPRQWLLHDNACAFCPQVRPVFLGLQCAMSIGLARRALAETKQRLEGSRQLLHAEWQALQTRLEQLTTALYQGIASQRFVQAASELFRIRIQLAELTAQALQLELQASGGRAYLQRYNRDFARRWRESAFIPLITPSLVQLRGQLQQLTGAAP